MGAILFAFGFGWLINFHNKTQSHESTIQAADLTISSWSELQNFATNVNNGTNYSGKTIELNSDIDCGGNNLAFNKEFAGTLNGGGFKISNCNSASYYCLEGYSGQKQHVFGLFLYFAGTIKNLHLDNFTCKLDQSPGTGSLWYVGGLVGQCYNNGTIDNCKVTNFKVTKGVEIEPGGASYYDIQDINISGIAAMGNPKVINCYVENITSEYSSIADKLDVIINGIVIGTSVSFATSSYTSTCSNANISIKQCVVKGNFTKSYTSDSNQNSYVSNCYSSITGDEFAKLSPSTSGGSSGSTWYYASEYSSWPCLRKFIDWKTVKISVLISNTGSVSPTSVQIPSDADMTGYHLNSATGSIYDQVVKATPNAGYKFHSWSTVAEERCVVRFVYKTFTISFASLDDYGATSTPAEMTVYYGYTIKAELLHSASATTITYCITDKDGSTTNRTYSVATKYTLDSYGSVNGTAIKTTDITIGDWTDGATYTITPKVKLKSYSVKFE